MGPTTWPSMLAATLMSLTRPVMRWFDRIPIRFGNISLSPLWAGLAIRLVKMTLDYIGMPAFPL